MRPAREAAPPEVLRPKAAARRPQHRCERADAHGLLQNGDRLAC